ncbi:MAG: SAM-dependent chlorinase/fluorinase [Candidatus Methanomethyliaceae archaeon]|nr:SAM-dependent chlorinase/fluorinase [Candidatus Methanomethyliaceae archaeon]
MVLVTLTTDFRGHYLGIMKGVIKNRAPAAEVVELSSEVEPFDVKGASFVLYSSYRYFPRGTIHVVVVDPGVGSARKAIAIKTKNYTFIGPDNGVLIPASKDDEIVLVREITNRSLFLKEVSSTFHGRDIFAAIAAFLASGGRLEEVGKRLKKFEEIKFFKEIGGDGAMACEVLFVDRFGNLTLSIKKEDTRLEDIEITVGDRSYRARRSGTYADGEGLLLIVGSAGFYELAVKNGSASELIRALVGDRIAIKRV